MDPQIIRTDTGEELVVLTRTAYEALKARADGPSEADEDAGMLRIVARSDRALAEGRDIEIPAEVATAIADGANVLRSLRKWRSLTQTQLAERSGVRQSDLSRMETGERDIPTASLRCLAEALHVPVDALIE